MYLNTIPGTKIAEQVASSDKPWIYLTVVLIILFAAGCLYIGKYLINLDKNNRVETKEREKTLFEQIEKQNGFMDRIVQTQNDILKVTTDLNTRVERLERHTYRKGGE